MSKDTAPLVSIIVPVYNAASFLGETIQTVLCQTYKNWELILVDDKSSDESVDLIEEAQVKDPRIQLIKLSVNSGAAHARNVGLESANGQYIAFLDADDLWLPGKLKLQMDAIRSTSSGFLYGSYQFANEKGAPVAGPVSVPLSISYKEALKNPIIWTSTVLVDTGIVSKSLLKMPDVRRGQDAATWWRILRVTGERAIGLQASLAYYRRTNGTLSSNKWRALSRTWCLYRKVEGLGYIKSFYYFMFYIMNAIKKRV